MKKYFIVLFVFLGLIKIHAQGFSGSIEFKYTTLKDTTTNIYFVKDKVIKLDNYGRKTGALEGSYIFDLTANTIKWVNPKRKVWGEHKSEIPPVIRGVCEVIKGTATKSIAGIKCKDYTVKNTEENTSITYWMAENKFNFFSPLIKLWNRKDRPTIYFSQIKDLPEGSMPLLCEEKQISDGKMITKLEAIKINNKMPDDASVAVPAGYTKFD